ncbi:DUF3096 domain-containing protein [bacterium]|nr:DUF3096 domain-containing protein [bacterium]
MLEVQIFQVLGIIYLVVGLGMIINTKDYKKMIYNFSENNPVKYISGALALFVGYLLVTFFSSDSWNLTLVLTVIGWIAIVKGVLILIFPKLMNKIIKRIKERLIFSIGILAVVLGIVFIYLGYLA